MFLRRPAAESPDCIIIGLGNPGVQYAGTRHNLGWWVLDELARRHKVNRTASKHNSQVDWLRIGAEGAERRQVALVKPTTFMNLSGRAVAGWRRAYPESAMVVVYDDIALPLGKLRLRRKGSAGGHNGIKSIIASIGEAFDRLKIGLGAPPGSMDSADYVLAKPARREAEELGLAVQNAADLLEILIEGGYEAAMRRLGQSADEVDGAAGELP
jgi:PTH1 family peptidyl-tRNA hydrolase